MDEIEVSIEDYKKFCKLCVAHDQGNPRDGMLIQESPCSCTENRAWIRVRSLEKYGFSDLFTCTECSAIHICNEQCVHLKMTRESWVCDISGLEKYPMFASASFSTHVVSPVNRSSRCKKIVVGHPSNADDIGESAHERRITCMEKYKQTVDSVLDRVIFNDERHQKNVMRSKKSANEIPKMIKKVASTAVSSPKSVIELAEELMAFNERMMGGNWDPTDTTLRVHKSRLKERLKAIVSTIRFTLMTEIKRRHQPKTEYQILSILYLLQSGWPGVFNGDEFLKRYMPMKKELQWSPHINLNRLSKSHRDTKRHFHEKVFSSTSETRVFKSILDQNPT